jgi:hypothetical protein
MTAAIRDHREQMSALTRAFEVQLALGRSFVIENARENRSLSRIGISLLREAAEGYLLHHREEAAELREKAQRFLRLAYETQERPKHDYVRGYDEAMRAAALSYADWLATDVLDSRLLEDAREGLKTYFLRKRSFDRSTAEIDAPVLLYTRAYPLFVELADRFSLSPISESGKKKPGVVSAALRVALAKDESERRRAIDGLTKSVAKRLPGWISGNRFEYLGYALHALFPRPEGEPSKLIDEAWQYIPDENV